MTGQLFALDSVYPSGFFLQLSVDELRFHGLIAALVAHFSFYFLNVAPANDAKA